MRLLCAWNGCKTAMEKFAVDLDKVLDEFEESEGLLASKPTHRGTKDSAAGIAGSHVGNSVPSLPNPFNSPPNQNGDHSPSLQLSANGNLLSNKEKDFPLFLDRSAVTAEITSPGVTETAARAAGGELFHFGGRAIDLTRHSFDTGAVEGLAKDVVRPETVIGNERSDRVEDVVVGHGQPCKVFSLEHTEKQDDEKEKKAVDLPPLWKAGSPYVETTSKSDVDLMCVSSTTESEVTVAAARASLLDEPVCAIGPLQDDERAKGQTSEAQSVSGSLIEGVCEENQQSLDLGNQEDEKNSTKIVEGQVDPVEPSETCLTPLPSSRLTCGGEPGASSETSLSALVNDPITLPDDCDVRNLVLPDSSRRNGTDGLAQPVTPGAGNDQPQSEPVSSSEERPTAVDEGRPNTSGSLPARTTPPSPELNEDEVLRVSVANGVQIQLVPRDELDIEATRSDPTENSQCSLTGEATVITEDDVPTEEGDGAGLRFEPATEVTDRELESLLALEEEEGRVSSPQAEEEESFLPPLSEEEQLLGKVKPFWIPDMDAPACMLCDTRFTVLKRRHHCRACGKVLCGNCCSQKSKLPCLENKEGRVCQPCLTVLNRVAAVERLSSPNPNNPEEYCSRGPPSFQNSPTSDEAPPLSVLVPVLRRGPRPGGEPPKQVVFSDGIRPGGDLTEIADGPSLPPASRPRGVKEVTLPGGGQDEIDTSPSRVCTTKKVVVSDAEGALPPIMLSGPLANETLDANRLVGLLKDETAEPVTFTLTKNLHVFVKIVKLDCCMNCECWCFSSHGLSALGQDEVLLVFDYAEGESTVPRDALRLFSTLHDGASRGGTPVGPLGHLLFPDGVLGSRDQSGFLFVPPTLQCTKKLPLPRAPWLAAVLVHRWEVSWAKLLPLRLVLRLGSEYRYYPCPLMSVRFRKPVYGEVGHTIMNVLLDFRNFQYGLPCLGGLVVHVEGQRTTVHVPRNRYDALCRVMDSNEHVLALGANLSPKADSHLVCVQGDEGTYHTQAVHVAHTEQKITGATFVVFSGALKGAGEAKCSVVEDGLLVQLAPTAMAALRSALRAMKDWEAQSGPEETVAVAWDEDDRCCNIGVTSPVDGQSREGVQSIKIRNATDYSSQRHLIRWTEVFFLHTDDVKKTSEESQRVAEALAKSFCMVMLPHLGLLYSMRIVGLRVQMGPEQVGYEAGADGNPLPASCLGELDGALVPLLTTAQECLSVELVFHILLK